MFYLFVSTFLSGSKEDESYYCLRVEIKDIQSSLGESQVSIFNNPITLNEDTDMLEQKIIRDFESEMTIIVFDSPKVGEYAVFVLQDDNTNQYMYFNFVGVPKEGYCFSNNVRTKL